MQFEDWLDTLNLRLVVTRYPQQNNRWSADIDGAEVKQNGTLLGERGNGNNPQQAITDYLNKIKGKTIVINAMDRDRRKEYFVVETVEY